MRAPGGIRTPTPVLGTTTSRWRVCHSTTGAQADMVRSSCPCQPLITPYGALTSLTCVCLARTRVWLAASPTGGLATCIRNIVAHFFSHANRVVFKWRLGELECDGFSVRLCPKIDHFDESAVLSRLTGGACSAEDYRHTVSV